MFRPEIRNQKTSLNFAKILIKVPFLSFLYYVSNI